MKLKTEIRKIVDEIYSYEEGDTGDIPGYYIDEDMDSFVDALLALFKKTIKGVVPKEKEKHDNIENVLDDEYPDGYLLDCSHREAQCYNAAIKDILSNLEEKIK